MKTKLAALSFAITTALATPAFAFVPLTLYNDAGDELCAVDPARCWNADIFTLTAQTLTDTLPQFSKDWHKRRHYRVFADGKDRRGFRIYFTDNPVLCSYYSVGYNYSQLKYAVVCVAENFVEQQYPVSQVATHEAFEMLDGKEICDPVNSQTHIDSLTGQTVADYIMPQ